MIVTGTEGLSAVLGLCLVCCSPSRQRGGFGDVNSTGQAEAWACCVRLLPPAEAPLTLPVGSEVWPRTVLRQVQKAWDLLQQRLSP